jgi:phospholipid/cholesterol/gamma-HCH transport system substrate-binding protein
VNFAAVGAFVLALGAVLIAGVLWLAAGGASRKPYDLYGAIEDESVAGLNLNAPVKYNGVTVGKVRAIALDAVNPERVRLVFAIERGTPIKVDTVAVLKTQGLTGIAYVELAGGARDAAPLVATTPDELPLIRTKPSLAARLENVLTTVLAKLDRTSNNLNAVLSDANRAALTSALADIAALSHTLAERKATMSAGITSAASAMARGNQAAAELGPLIERIGRGADAVEQFGQQGAQAASGAGKTVEAVGADLKHLTADTLPELQRLLGELSVLSASLRRVSEQAERDPASLLSGRGVVPDGPGESPPGARKP